MHFTVLNRLFTIVCFGKKSGVSLWDFFKNFHAFQRILSLLYNHFLKDNFWVEVRELPSGYSTILDIPFVMKTWPKKQHSLYSKYIATDCDRTKYTLTKYTGKKYIRTIHTGQNIKGSEWEKRWEKYVDRSMIQDCRINKCMMIMTLGSGPSGGLENDAGGMNGKGLEGWVRIVGEEHSDRLWANCYYY